LVRDLDYDAGYDLRIVQRLFGHRTSKSAGRHAKHQRGYLPSAIAIVDRPLLSAEQGDGSGLFEASPELTGSVKGRGKGPERF
jgi:hypothetical protein